MLRWWLPASRAKWFWNKYVTGVTNIYFLITFLDASFIMCEAFESEVCCKTQGIVDECPQNSPNLAASSWRITMIRNHWLICGCFLILFLWAYPGMLPRQRCFRWGRESQSFPSDHLTPPFLTSVQLYSWSSMMDHHCIAPMARQWPAWHGWVIGFCICGF